MAKILRLLILVVITYLALRLWRALSLFLRSNRARRAHGCKPAVKYPHTDRLHGSNLTALRKRALQDGRLVQLYVDQHNDLGETWEEHVDGQTVVNTISAANFRYMYVLHMSEFRRAISPASWHLFGRRGILVDGDEWKWSRKRIESIFSKNETATMPMVERHVDQFMKGLLRDGRTVDLQPLVKKLFIDLMTEFLFGESLSMQDAGEGQHREDFLRTLDSALLGLNKRRQGFNLTTVKLLFDRSYARDIAKVHAFIDEKVDAALKRTALNSGAEPSNLVIPKILDRDTSNKLTRDRYILADQLAKQIRDPIYLRSTLLQCFMPGRDSPAILLSNTLFALARRPEYWNRLRLTAQSFSPSDLLCFRKLSTLHPVRHAIFEALRLYGPGGGNRRRAAVDLVLPNGGGPDGASPLFVAKGTVVQTFLPAMHRNKGLWGDDAGVWRAERFEGWDGGWEFKPFLAGPRTCPAKDQTIVQVTYILVRLLREFERLECRDEVREFVEVTRLTTESRRGVRVGLIS